MTIIEAVIQEVEKFNDSIRDALDSKNITNTGEAARSLYIEHGEDYVRSLGIFYLEFLDTGRGPGKYPPFEAIMEWAIQKTGQKRSELYGLVRYVQKKIATLGTEIYRKKSKGIELEKKVLLLKEEILAIIPKYINAEITKKLDRFKKKYEFNL